jgi:hypothetical protein
VAIVQKGSTMDARKIEKLFELIGELVRSPGPWKDKAEEIKIEASEDDLTNLNELISWFQEEET